LKPVPSKLRIVEGDYHQKGEFNLFELALGSGWLWCMGFSTMFSIWTQLRVSLLDRPMVQRLAVPTVVEKRRFK
jgi:hypothetical protein